MRSRFVSERFAIAKATNRRSIRYAIMVGSSHFPSQNRRTRIRLRLLLEKQADRANQDSL
jgi:hypothetical protein